MDLLKNTLLPSNANNSAAHWGIYDLLLLLGALFALTLLLVIWAKYIRKEKRSRRRSHSSKEYELVPVAKASGAGENDENEDEGDEPDARRRRKFRKRRREHRGRNPTLAETGGLPPLRDGNSVNPPQ